MKPTIRELRPSDMDKYVTLCEARKGLDRAAAERRAEIVEWVAFHNPDADGKPTYFVIELGDRLMGHLGRMPTRFYLGGEPHLASYFHDLFIHPELVEAGQGFFLAMRMYREAEKASNSFCAMVWTNEINIRLQKARRYFQMWTDRQVKLLRADAHIDRQLAQRLGARLDVPVVKMAGKAMAATALRFADGLLGTALTLRPGPGGSDVVQVDHFDDRFDRLAQTMGPRMGIAPIKSAAYLRWKYSDRPQIQTECFAAIDEHGQSGELRGFTVVAVPDSAHRESFILELCADPEDTQTVTQLLYRAVEHCRGSGAYTVQAVATDPRIRAVLKRFLFTPRPPREPFFMAKLDRYNRPEVLQSPGNWHFSFGDSEGPV